MTTPPDTNQSGPEEGRGPLIFCGMCGALNPATNFYCAACGTTLVDAFHATEGLRVFERPDSASRLIEIVPSGTELEVADDPDAPEDFVRVRLQHGRLGYIRMQDVDALANLSGAVHRTTPAGRPMPDINTNATGCISSTAALGSVVLVAMLGLLMIVIAMRANTYDQGTLALVFCFGIGPLMIMTVAFYLYAKSREDRLADEDDEAALHQADIRE
ncbi:MAG TPA: SH3 domain-containing protein [Thermomicrobiales bacterium]|nr:SH3 domain-containing protein [Thermomicrobiales bacterium]